MGSPVDHTRPRVGEQVHYVSYGTPGGEYQSRCRAAIVTEVGQWVTVATEPRESFDRSEGRAIRFAEQWFYSDALALCVLNPTGLFFNGAGPVGCRHDPGVLSGVPREGGHHGGTWHRAGEGGCTA